MNKCQMLKLEVNTRWHLKKICTRTVLNKVVTNEKQIFLFVKWIAKDDVSSIVWEVPITTVCSVPDTNVIITMSGKYHLDNSKDNFETNDK